VDVDVITEQLVGYTSAFSEVQISASAREAARRHIVDTVACAIAGYDLAAPRAARAVATMTPDANGATIFGDGTRVMPEMAAFANATAVRSTEWNDGMLAMGGGHASDMIPAIVGVGQVMKASPRDVFTSIVLAYELLGALGNTFYRRKMNWGIGTNVCPAAALAIGKLAGLTEQQLAWATAHAVLTVPLGADGGHGTMVKGASVAKVLRTAIFAVNLAKAGLAATPDPYAGIGGVFEKVSGGPFELTLPAMPGGPMVIETSYLKRYPTEAHSQALIGFVLDRVRPWTTADELESFEIETYWHAVDSLGRRDKGVWDPQTRERADHSLPYLLGRALVDGALSFRSSFTEDRVADPALRRIMDKISIREDEAITADYRKPGMEIIGNPRYRVRLRKTSGEELDEDVTFPKGHYYNPMTVDDINAKFDDASDGVIGEAHKDEIRAAWWAFEDAPSVEALVATIATYR
jgi:2-methylcitrate dehydratase